MQVFLECVMRKLMFLRLGGLNSQHIYKTAYLGHTVGEQLGEEVAKERACVQIEFIPSELTWNAYFFCVFWLVDVHVCVDYTHHASAEARVRKSPQSCSGILYAWEKIRHGALCYITLLVQPSLSHMVYRYTSTTWRRVCVCLEVSHVSTAQQNFALHHVTCVWISHHLREEAFVMLTLAGSEVAAYAMLNGVILKLLQYSIS